MDTAVLHPEVLEDRDDHTLKAVDWDVHIPAGEGDTADLHLEVEEDKDVHIPAGEGDTADLLLEVEEDKDDHIPAGEGDRGDHILKAVDRDVHPRTGAEKAALPTREGWQRRGSSPKLSHKG